MTDKNFPKPEDVQKEFEEFVHKRFGNQVQIITQEFPFQSLAKKKSKQDKQQDKFDLKFDLVPKDIKSYLDRFIIEQDEAKKALAIAVCDHYNQVTHHHQSSDKHNDSYVKQNVLILGPTGVGKTYMIKQIAKLIGVPFVKADATRFSETGYVGANVDDLIKDLVAQADGNIEKAQYGIVYLDEADKLASPRSSMGRDVSGRGVQLGLLKLMEETEVDLRSGHDPASQMQAFIEMQQKGKVERQLVNTRHILFIVSGAFTGLEEIIQKRLNKNNIGFSSSPNTRETPDEMLNFASTQDFIDFGFEPEFIGRLPIRVACQHLNENALFSILKNSEGSIIKQYAFAFQSYHIEARFDDASLLEIAKLAAKEKTGARALMTILEKIFRDFKYELPSTHILQLDINKDLIQNPKAQLDKILQNLGDMERSDLALIKEFEQMFAKQYQMSISFDRTAIRFLCAESKKDQIPVDQLCQKLLQSYEYGFKLIEQNTGQSHFVLSEDTVRRPAETLEKLVKDSYTWKMNNSNPPVSH